MKVLWFTLVLFISATSCASVKSENFDVAEYYATLSSDYEKSLSVGNYQKAYAIAVEQLNLDPSDTVAYLRMAIAVQHLKVDKEKILKDYSPEISEMDLFHVQIKSIANALLQAPENK